MLLPCSWDAWQAVYIPWCYRNTFVRSAPASMMMLMSWVGSMPIISLSVFCTVYRKHTWMVKWGSIWNWPSCWVNHCHYTTEMWVLVAAGHLMLLSHLICLLRSRPAVDFRNYLLFIYLFIWVTSHQFLSPPKCTWKTVFFGSDGHLMLHLSTTCR